MRKSSELKPSGIYKFKSCSRVSLYEGSRGADSCSACYKVGIGVSSCQASLGVGDSTEELCCSLSWRISSGIDFTKPYTLSQYDSTLQVPACYKQTPPRLKPGYFSKFQQDTLFYIFYSMPADEAQIFAADELASRGWGFNKEMKVALPPFLRRLLI